MHFTAEQPLIAATQSKQELAQTESGDHHYHNSGRLASFRLRENSVTFVSVCQPPREQTAASTCVRTLDGSDIELARRPAKPQFTLEFL